MSPACLAALERLALRHARTRDEADDLVQDLLVIALEQERPCDGASFLAWASGVLRRHAAFVARTAGRRRRREAAYAAEASPAPERARKLPRAFIDSLPPSLRTVAVLVNAGLGRSEIASLLRIPDTALRQRISGLRRAWRTSGATAEFVEPPPSLPVAGGRRRHALKTTLLGLAGGRLAVADPDGHPIFFGTAHETPADGNKGVKRVKPKP